jgi:hypothetical protein
MLTLKTLMKPNGSSSMPDILSTVKELMPMFGLVMKNTKLLLKLIT